MNTKKKDIERFCNVKDNWSKELVINYPSSLNSAFYLSELTWFYGAKNFRIRYRSEVAFINRDISGTLFIRKKTYIEGNILSSARIFVYAKTIIKGFVFGKIISVKPDLVEIV